MTLAGIPITITRSRRRTIALHVSPAGDVTVRAPRWAPKGSIDDFVRRHAAWVEKAVERVQTLQRRFPPLQFENGASLPIWGAPLTLQIAPAGGREAQWTVDDQHLRISLPNPTPARVRRLVRHALAQAVLQRVAERMPAFVEGMNVRPGPVSVGFAKYRWGSCSSNGRLRFNGRLALMPPALLDYVLVHELAHLREMNHSKRFWEVVERALPDYRQWRRWMRDHATAFDIPG